MTTLTEAAGAVVAALTDADVRVAVRPGDFTPPCAYVQLWGGSDESMLEGGHRTTLAVYWVPIRGMADLWSDAEGLGATLAALSPVTAEAVVFTSTSVTVGDQSWPAYRADVVVI